MPEPPSERLWPAGSTTRLTQAQVHSAAGLERVDTLTTRHWLQRQQLYTNRYWRSAFPAGGRSLPMAGLLLSSTRATYVPYCLRNSSAIDTGL